MQKNEDYDWDEVLSAASRLQGLVREAVLVGGTASVLFAGHRTLYDADHVVPDLRHIQAQLEQQERTRTQSQGHGHGLTREIER